MLTLSVILKFFLTKYSGFFLTTLDTLLNVFFAIAVDSLAEAKELSSADDQKVCKHKNTKSTF